MIIITSSLIVALFLLVPGFESEFEQATEETGLNFLLVEHEDQSVTLYSWNNETTTVEADGFPNKMTPLKGYPNIESLSGANGVVDVLSKIKDWNNLVPEAKAVEWWEATPAAKERANNITAEERAESLKDFQHALNKLELAKTDPDKYWELTFKEQLQAARERTIEAQNMTITADK